MLFVALLPNPPKLNPLDLFVFPKLNPLLLLVLPNPVLVVEDPKLKPVLVGVVVVLLAVDPKLKPVEVLAAVDPKPVLVVVDVLPKEKPVEAGLAAVEPKLKVIFRVMDLTRGWGFFCNRKNHHEFFGQQISMFSFSRIEFYQN